MMPQMDSGQPVRDGYGAYEGNRSYSPPPQYETPYQGSQANTYDDDYIDGLAQRLSQRMAQGPQGKIQPPVSTKVSAGQRLALAIVSVLVLVPLAAILMAGVGGFGGLAAFGAACFAIMIINATFSVGHH